MLIFARYAEEMEQDWRILRICTAWPEIFRPQHELEEGKAGGIPASDDDKRCVLDGARDHMSYQGRQSRRIWLRRRAPVGIDRRLGRKESCNKHNFGHGLLTLDMLKRKIGMG